MQITGNPESSTFVASIIGQLVEEAPDRTNYSALADRFIAEFSTQHPGLWEEYIAPAIHDKVLNDIRSYIAMQRKSRAFKQVKNTAANRRRGEKTYYSVGNKQIARLRSMTKSEVLEVAAHLDSTANGLAFKATLLCRIARRMKAGQVVSDVWTDEKLSTLLGETVVLDAA